MALNSTVVAKAQAETRGNFHSIQVRNGFLLIFIIFQF